MNSDTENPLTVVLIVSFDRWSQFYLAYIKISHVYDVIYDLIKGEGSVSNCTASYWSVLFTLVSHMTFVYFECPDWFTQVTWPNSFTRQFSISLPLSNGIFYANKIILHLKLFVFKSMGCLCPTFHKIAIARGQITSRLGMPGVSGLRKNKLI